MTARTFVNSQRLSWKGGWVLGALLALLLVSSSSGEAASFIYWGDPSTDKIHRANLDGSGVTDLVTGLSNVESLALDVAGGHMYWADRGTDKIQRANLDGSGVTDLVTTPNVYALALDVAGGHMYWTDTTLDKIQRSNLDGSGVTDLVTTGLFNARGFTLDVAGGHMYWTDLRSLLKTLVG